MHIHPEDEETRVREFDREIARIFRTPRPFSYARALTRDDDAAYDLVQETMFRAIRARDSFESGSNMDAWLSTIMRNQFFSDCRRARVHARALSGDTTSSDGDWLHYPTSSAGNQHDALELREQIALMGLLPEDQRVALESIALGRTYEDVACELDLSLGTLKSRVSRARSGMRALTVARR